MRSLQRGVGLLELMLAMAISAALVIASIQAYRSYQAQANVQIIKTAVAIIQDAVNAYFLSTCGSGAMSSLTYGAWQDIDDVLSPYAPEISSLDNPWGNRFTKSYYQIQFMQLSNNNVIVCVQMTVNHLPTDGNAMSQYANLVGATSYGTSAGQGQCKGSASSSLVWQSVPSIGVSGFMNPQVIERLKVFRNENPQDLGTVSCPMT